MSLRFLTAGESHGPGLTVIVDGLPAGIPVDGDEINRQMRRRMAGHGRGGRMAIERDLVEITGIGCDPIAGLNPTGGTVALDLADERQIEGTLNVTTEQGLVTGAIRALTCEAEPLFACGP